MNSKAQLLLVLRSVNYSKKMIFKLKNTFIINKIEII